MKVLWISLMIFSLTSICLSQDVKYQIPAIDDSTLWFNTEELDTVEVRWDQPAETDIDSYVFYFTESPDVWNFGIDSVSYKPKYMEMFNDWVVYDTDGNPIKWGNSLTIAVPLGRYMCQLSAFDFAQNESIPSEPVWLNIEKSPYSFQPRGITIIIYKYQP